MTVGACGKMRGRFCILAIATLIIAATAFCACAPGEEYLPVTTEELIGNVTAYDRQNVTVTGAVVNHMIDTFGSRICLWEPSWGENPPCENVTVETNLDEYYPYYFSHWGVSSSGYKGTKNVVAFTRSGTSTWKDFPDFEEGQQIEIRGSIHVTTIEVPHCIQCFVEERSTLYITVRPENVKIIPGQ
jgi:hypothetical protein